MRTRIGIEPGRARQVVGEELERDGQDERGEPLRHGGEREATAAVGTASPPLSMASVSKPSSASAGAASAARAASRAVRRRGRRPGRGDRPTRTAGGRTPPCRRSRRGCGSARRAWRRRTRRSRDAARRRGSERRYGRRPAPRSATSVVARSASAISRGSALERLGDRARRRPPRPVGGPARRPARPRTPQQQQDQGEHRPGVRRGPAEERRQLRNVERDRDRGALGQPAAAAVGEHEPRHAARPRRAPRLDRPVDVARHRDGDDPVGRREARRR